MYIVFILIFRSRFFIMFKVEILVDGVNGVLVEDFKGIFKINLYLYCFCLFK